MFGAQSCANVRQIRRQLQQLGKEDLSAVQYMHKMKALADTMAVAGSPLDEDELVDYIISGLGPMFNAIAASLTVGNKSVSYDDFTLTSSPSRLLMTHKYRGCIVVLSINKSVEPNEEQKVLISGFDQGFTINTSKRVFRGIW
jgi:hypothetical protein